MKQLLYLTILGLSVLSFSGCEAMKQRTKQASPEQTISYTLAGTNGESAEIQVFYNRPGKKDRAIFGELVPYGEVWRTGANEATTFECNANLSIGGETLAAGTYTLWTIPGANEWQVIFNKEMYPWGIKFNGKASRDPEFDALQVSVPVESLSEVIERFTIDLQLEDSSHQMTLKWDQTQISVPISLE